MSNTKAPAADPAKEPTFEALRDAALRDPAALAAAVAAGLGDWPDVTRAPVVAALENAARPATGPDGRDALVYWLFSQVVDGLPFEMTWRYKGALRIALFRALRDLPPAPTPQVAEAGVWIRDFEAFKAAVDAALPASWAPLDTPWSGITRKDVRAALDRLFANLTTMCVSRENRAAWLDAAARLLPDTWERYLPAYVAATRAALSAALDRLTPPRYVLGRPLSAASAPAPAAQPDPELLDVKALLADVHLGLHDAGYNEHLLLTVRGALTGALGMQPRVPFPHPEAFWAGLAGGRLYALPDTTQEAVRAVVLDALRRQKDLVRDPGREGHPRLTQAEFLDKAGSLYAEAKRYGRPLREVTLTDREPGVAAPAGHWYWEVGHSPNYRAGLSSPLFDHLPLGLPDASGVYRVTRRDYPSRDLALAALSDACLAYARSQASGSAAAPA